jgi:hypothetical protein
MTLLGAAHLGHHIYIRDSNLLLAKHIKSSSDLKSTRNWSKSTLHYGIDQLLAETM